MGGGMDGWIPIYILLKFTLSFASPEKENYYFIYYAVIVKQKIYKRSSNYY